MYTLPDTHHPRFHLQNYYLSTTYYLIFTSVCSFSAQQIILISTPRTFPTCHLGSASVYLKNVVSPRDYLRLYPQIFSLCVHELLPQLNLSMFVLCTTDSSLLSKPPCLSNTDYFLFTSKDLFIFYHEDYIKFYFLFLIYCFIFSLLLIY